MNIVRSTLGIVDMQTEYVPGEGCTSYIEKRCELVSNILHLADSTLSRNGRVIFINTDGHGENIPELEYLKGYQKVVSFTKFYNSLLHFDNIPRFNQIQNSSTMKKSLLGDEFLIVGVNASWCVLETAKSVKKLRESDPKYGATITVPFSATMNIPYPESLTGSPELLKINEVQSVRSEYMKYVGKDVLVGRSFFE
ncbi:hypothetical protein KBD33_01240 [Candidatus Gracilibacteria bacterium]|nr:hypothetical protein [Candidatus Gracilibacteria bacterium]